MLAIKKRHKAVKVITAGSIAFAVGLTGAAAYVDRSQQHENFAFNKEQTVENPSPTTPASTPATADNVQGASSGNGTAMPQATGSTRTLAPAPVASQSTAPVASVAPAPTAPAATATPSTTITPAPGMGGGSGGGSGSQIPDKEEDPDLIDQVLDVLPSL